MLVKIELVVLLLKRKFGGSEGDISVRDGPVQHPLPQCVPALSGWLVMVSGFSVLLASGPLVGIMCGHLSGEASALAGSLFLAERVCAGVGSRLLTAPAAFFAAGPGGVHSVGSPAGRAPALPLHLLQARQEPG